ncbi:MAG: HNH endonuclease signature motif containing protein [archaeon]
MVNHAKISGEDRQNLIELVRGEIELDRAGRLERYTPFSVFAERFGVNGDNVEGYVARSGIPQTDLRFRGKRIRSQALAERNKKGKGRKMPESQRRAISERFRGRKVDEGTRRRIAETRGYLTPEKRGELVEVVKEEIELNKLGDLEGFTTNAGLMERFGASQDAVLYTLRTSSIPLEDRRLRTAYFRGLANPASGKTGKGVPRSKKLADEQRRELVELVSSEVNNYRAGEDVTFTTNGELREKFGVGRKTLRGYLIAGGISEGDLEFRSRKLKAQIQVGRERTDEERKKLSESRRGRFTGEANPNFRGWSSIVPYSPFFYFVMRPLIRERDGYVCQGCREPENGRAHDVHHIDYDKGNNSEENLVLLCKDCHLTTNGNRGFWQGACYQIVHGIYREMSKERRVELDALQEKLERENEPRVGEVG